MTDNMKPIRCRCGGEAEAYEIHFWGKCYVCECTECGMTTKPKDTEAEAIEAWNRAMGADHFREVTEKVDHTAHWILSGTVQCSACGYVSEIETDVCPSCGSRMVENE